MDSFNPRAREGRDLPAFVQPERFGVSIHAPVKGATRKCCILRNFHEVSIHAPVKGATHNLRQI